MTSATLHSSNPSPVGQPSVGNALHGLLAATRQLAIALWVAATHRSKTATLPLTAFQEAEQLRAMADDLLSTDPHFAHELYCAANRHEQSQGF